MASGSKTYISSFMTISLRIQANIVATASTISETALLLLLMGENYEVRR
jgi:hypothetical protein